MTRVGSQRHRKNIYYRYNVAYHQDTTYQVTAASYIKQVNVFWLNGEVDRRVYDFLGVITPCGRVFLNSLEKLVHYIYHFPL
jgi:hypothetical protein